jgi:hypothetical protein
MPAIVYKFVRHASRAPDLGVSDFALVIAFSLAGLVLSFLMVHFGLDYGAGVPG